MAQQNEEKEEKGNKKDKKGNMNNTNVSLEDLELTKIYEEVQEMKVEPMVNIDYCIILDRWIQRRQSINHRHWIPQWLSIRQVHDDCVRCDWFQSGRENGESEIGNSDKKEWW